MIAITQFRKTVPVFLLAAISILVGCSKERIEPEELNSYESMNEYFDSKKQEEQVYVIDSGGTNPLIGKEGTKLWISKDKLMFQNGDAVTWPYTVKLVELYPAKEMIYYQMPNETSGQTFTCHGEIRIRAYKDGQELVLRQGMSWTIEMPNSNPTGGMKVYYGTSVSSNANWSSSTGEFTSSNYGYSGEAFTLGWIAAGKSLGTASPVNCTFTSSTDVLDNVSAYIYLPNQRSLTQIQNQASISLPSGEKVKIILMGQTSSGDIYHWYKEAIISSSTVFDVEMVEISDSKLTKLLDGL